MMKYISLYILIGLVYSGMLIPGIAKTVREKYDNEDDKSMSDLFTMIVIPTLVTPLWPMFVTMKIARLFNKKKVA